jgi:TetR/AcrR family transcriptional repressor of mexJK operon
LIVKRDLVGARMEAPRPSRKRTAILDAAADLFLEQGYARASMDAVAARARVSKQTVYAHFGTKEALFLAMARHLTGDAVARHRARVDDGLAGDDPAAALAAFARALLGIVLTPRLMRLRRLAIAEAERFPGFGDTVFATGPGSSIARLAEAIAAWHAAGRLNAPDAPRAGAMFNWMVMGGPTSAAMLRPAQVSTPEDDAHVAECVRVFLAAYGPEAR